MNITEALHKLVQVAKVLYKLHGYQQLVEYDDIGTGRDITVFVLLGRMPQKLPGKGIAVFVLGKSTQHKCRL